MNKEIEIKIQIDEETFATIKKWLKENATHEGQQHQVDCYLNKPDSPFYFMSPKGRRTALKYLRIRETDKDSSLCFKQAYVNEKNGSLLYFDEYEVVVADSKTAFQIMDALGYTERTVVDKTRDIYCFDGFEVGIDDVKNVGLFVEVELKKAVADVSTGREMIHDFLKLIGVKKFMLQPEGYAQMMWNPELSDGEVVTL